MLDLAHTGAAGAGPIQFANGADPTLEFTVDTAPTHPVEDFIQGDFLQIDNFAYTQENFTGGVLTLKDASDQMVTVSLPGVVGSDLQFSIVNGDTLVGSDQPACYCADTMILTDCGEVAVEHLKVGDFLVTESGCLRPIKWIGTRAYSARFAGNNPDLLPIRFKAGSLADNVPARDLLVSPHHAMFLDGVLDSLRTSRQWRDHRP